MNATDGRRTQTSGSAESKYSVRVIRSGKFPVIRPDGYANAIATDRRTAMDGFNAMSGFTGRAQLIAEFSDKCDWMMVYL